MRYDTPIFFQSRIEGSYNPTTGNYEGEQVNEEEVFASVSPTGIETLRLVYGELRQGALTVQLQNHYKKPFTVIRINGRLYSVDRAINYRTKQIFIVTEQL